MSINRFPVAVDDTKTATEDTALTFPATDLVTSSDSDPNGDTPTVIAVSNPSGGTVVLANGNITFTPTSNLTGTGAGGFTYTISDPEGLTASADVDIDITAVNDAPVITSGTSTTPLPENNTATVVYDGAATDVESNPVTWSLEGPDIGFFNINASTGVVTHKSPGANFEARPTYAIDVVVTETSTVPALSARVSLVVTVTDVNEDPVITSGATGSVAENANVSTVVYLATATDVDAGATLTWSKSGTDSSLVAINANNGEVTLLSSANRENKSSYSFNVIVSDGQLSDTQAVVVSVVDVNEVPVIGSAAAASVAENQTAAIDVNATDPDLPAQTLTYSITAGADQALFAIDGASGVVTFKTAPNFELPSDAGANNVYDFTVSVTDGSLSVQQAIAITVTNANDAPVVTSNDVSVAENQADVLTLTATDADLPAQTLAFTIVGGADQARFQIVTGTSLRFLSAPNFEAPTDADVDNRYVVEVRVTDNGAPTANSSKVLTVTVTNVNEVPTLTSARSVSIAARNTACGLIYKVVTASPGSTP